MIWRARSPRDEPVQLPQITVTTPPPSVAEQTIDAQRYDRVDQPQFSQRALVIIDGVEYFEWTTVEVRLAVQEDPPNTFRLTVSEQNIPQGSTDAFRIVPGDVCEVYLDGYLAITGFVKTRQVFYSGGAHQVEIQGFGRAGRLSLTAATSQTGEFKDIPMLGLAQALAAPAGVGVVALGALSAMQIPRVSIQPGESAMEAIEKHARSVAAHIGETNSGQLVLADITSMGFDNVEYAVEGVNIVEAREVIQAEINANFPLTGQRPGDDNTSGSDSAQPYTNQSGSNAMGLGTATRSLMEIPAWSSILMGLRARHESIVSSTNNIEVTLTLQGWQRPHLGGLWWPLGDNVVVDSPMLVLRGVPLMLKAVTFTQDNERGSRATLELVNKFGDLAAQLGT
jgi:prophage tail gpP-like protein